MWVGERILTPGALVRQRSCSIEPGGGILERSVRTREVRLHTDQSLRVHPRPLVPQQSVQAFIRLRFTTWEITHYSLCGATGTQPGYIPLNI